MIDFSSYRAKDRRCTAYIQDPAKLDDVEKCAYYDGVAAEYIADMEAEIARMKEYRAQLFERIQVLYSTPTTLKITLEREKHWKGNVFYRLNFWRVSIDGSIPPKLESSTNYPGTQRAQAIKDYKAAVKAHPGVACEMNIEKRRWE